ncbi:HNH endonuclease [Pseudidiomarina halophila]|nr:HNH endonuclease [Pseudidiomarina halophila]
MPKIDRKTIEAAYDVAKRVHGRHISMTRGIEILETRNGMNPNSAVDYIYSYRNLIEGKRFTRTTNAAATRYYLEMIFKENGRDKLLNALSSLRQHIDYYETVGNSSVIKGKEIYEEFSRKAQVSTNDDYIFPDEVNETVELREGKVRSVHVNIYERNPAARAQCIEHYGCYCFICGFDFLNTYGEIGRDFIHVHHELELSTIGKEYVIDPVRDLKPVCPNCHSMIHRRKPAYSVDEIKEQLEKL